MNQEYIEWMRSEPELFKNSGKKGEIRIVTDQEEIRQVEEELQRKIGFVYEDEYVRLVRDAVIFPDEDEDWAWTNLRKEGQELLAEKDEME